MREPRSAPVLGHVRAFRADRLGFLARLAREHGDVAVFRIGPYRIWQLSHPRDIHDVLVTSAHRFRKGPVLQRARMVLGDGLLTAEGQVHRRHRRLMQPAFHPHRVEHYSGVMVAHAAATADRWVPGSPVDLHAETVRTTMTVAGSTLLGTNVDADADAVRDAIADLLSAYKLAFVPFGWRLQHLPVGPMRRLQRGRTTLHRLVDAMIAERRAGVDAAAADLLSALVSHDGHEALSDAEIRDEALTLLLAGHETTANALTFAFHLMAGDPAVEAQVHDEVDGVLAGRLPVAADLQRLPTCRGLLSEALRLYPPSWAMGRQVIDAHRVGSTVIPAGDLVLLPQWVVHRDARWWREPQRCDPARWREDAARPRRSSFFPFGGGARRCIGESFAQSEGMLALSTIASRWRLLPVPDRPLRLDPLLTLRPRDGLWMRPVPR